MSSRFPNDKQTYAIDEQFLLGKHLLVSPVLYPVWQILESTVSGTVLIQRRSIFKNATTVRAYIPNARWYDYRTVSEQHLNIECCYRPLIRVAGLLNLYLEANIFKKQLFTIFLK